MSEPAVLSHWHQSVEGLSVDSTVFYMELKASIEALQIPGVDIFIVNNAEGGVFSAQRQYLRVRRQIYHFDICAAPFANGSFFSYWVTRDEGCLRGCLGAIPGLGLLLAAFVFNETYYRVDTRLMFQGAVHEAVMVALDRELTAKGLRSLSEDQRKESVTKLLG